MDRNDPNTQERLIDAGASPQFATVAMTERDERNSVGNRVARADDPEQLTRHGLGGYGQALWDGDMAEAFYQADAANTRLLLDVFGPENLISLAVADGEDPKHFRTIVSERVERYRPDMVDEMQLFTPSNPA